MELEELIKVLSKYDFINARKLSKELGITTHDSGRLLKLLSKLGVVEVYRARRGRFIIYRVRKRVGPTTNTMS